MDAVHELAQSNRSCNICNFIVLGIAKGLYFFCILTWKNCKLCLFKINYDSNVMLKFN